MKKLFKSNVTLLRKVATMVAYSQRMDGGAIILSPKNEAKRKMAEQHIYDAINLLESIE